MVYCILCNILLVALIILTSCSRQDDKASGTHAGEAGGRLREFPAAVHRDSSCGVSFRQQTGGDTSVMERLYDKSQKDLLRWSSLGGM